MLPAIKPPQTHYIQHARDIECAGAIPVFRRTYDSTSSHAQPLVPICKIRRDRILDIQVSALEVCRVGRCGCNVELFRDKVSVSIYQLISLSLSLENFELWNSPEIPRSISHPHRAPQPAPVVSETPRIEPVLKPHENLGKRRRRVDCRLSVS